jgi:hypothetical protein
MIILQNTRFSLTLFFLLINVNAYSTQNIDSIDTSDISIPEYQVKRYTKDFDLEFKHGTIKIINEFGNVVVKNTTHHTVGLSAVVQEIGSNPSIHKLDVKSKKDSLALEIKYSKSDIKKHKKTKSKFPIGRVDLVIFIPVDYKIDVETTFGKIEFKRVKNPIKSKSTSGGINVSSYYDMQAQSTKGQIKAFPMGVQWNKGIRLKSKSGTIYAIIPVNANLELDVKSNGIVKSQLQSISEWNITENKIKKSYGVKGKLYHIQSKTGDVYLSPHELVK